MISFELRPLPTHMNAPDAWSVWQTTVSVDEDGDDVTDLEMVAWGIPLGDALDQVGWLVAAGEDVRSVKVAGWE